MQKEELPSLSELRDKKHREVEQRMAILVDSQLEGTENFINSVETGAGFHDAMAVWRIYLAQMVKRCETELRHG